MVAAGEEKEGTRHVASSRAALRPASVCRDAARPQEVGEGQGRLPMCICGPGVFRYVGFWCGFLGL